MRDALKEQLLIELSRNNIDLITQWVEDNPKELVHLVQLITSHEKIVAQRASWVLEKLSERKSVDTNAHISEIIDILKEIPSSSTRRTISKVLMLHEIPDEQEGIVLDFAISMLESPKEPVAVKANSMTIVFNLLPKYPELKNEIIAIIEDQIPYNSVGFKSRFNVLKRKYKL